MSNIDFATAFRTLTGNSPFPWQRDLYETWFSKGKFPDACTLPTGLGKTAVVTIWLIALANAPAQVPRRLVYVVNRRTVVDQTTTEAERLRRNAAAARVPTPAISTLRGQFADNREWSADPSRPAIIAGTVDMIGSRLLFSGYGIGFKSRPLHAGFLGQDVLLVHDEAHLEPAFQTLLSAICKEQQRCGDFGTFRVMELSATSRSEGDVFELTKEEKNPPDTIPDPPEEPIHHVWRRQQAKKTLYLHANKDDKQLAEEIAALAQGEHTKGRAVLVFVRKVDEVEKVVKRLPKGSYEQLTGTRRGKERDELVESPIFRRFLPNVEPGSDTVYLVCTSAGEVGVNISGDHLVCDLSTFESMAQRFGRVNRFGDRDDTRIDIVHPKTFDETKEYDSRLRKTLNLLKELPGDGSPAALGKLDRKERLDAFAPEPFRLETSDILFDAWALTTIRVQLPGRPPVEPYLHGLASELPETHVTWRQEVWELRLQFKNGEDRQKREAEERKRLAKFASGLLEDYPLKPHELLRDNSRRVFDRLAKLKTAADTPVWVVGDDESVVVTTFGELIEVGKDNLSYKTVLLPPSAGGLENGMLASHSDTANDVADELRNEAGEQRRTRVWDDDPAPDGMRLIRTIDINPDAEEAEEESSGRRFWRWYELPKAADTEGSKSAQQPVTWKDHTEQVTENAIRIAAALKLPQEWQDAIKLAAQFHDLGKKRELWQRSIGNPNPKDWYAKSGRDWKQREINDYYRHEFGSLIDLENEPEFKGLSGEMKDLVRHLIAAHHGRGRPHFDLDEAFDPESDGKTVSEIAAGVPLRFARLQRKYGRWGLAYLESLLRAADYAASAKPATRSERSRSDHSHQR